MTWYFYERKKGFDIESHLGLLQMKLPSGGEKANNIFLYKWFCAEIFQIIWVIGV